MALKRVFQIDEDFQERMFAKQIAVMKGQAWNVVEALKTPDHGPLELTRRAKVCVWDDLVDVPVAVPMRVTSSEMRRPAFSHNPNPSSRQSMDEADIASSAPANNNNNADLLGIGPSPADMPHPGRFEISTPKGERAQSPTSGVDARDVDDMANGATSKKELPATATTNASRNSALNVYEPDRNAGNPRRQQRRYSFATPISRRNSSSIAQQLYGDQPYRAAYDADDDLEGDLGYATAEGQMALQRKVIVERLEAVKTSNPVFTWC